MKTIFILFFAIIAFSVNAQKPGSFVTNNKLMHMQDSTIKGNATTAYASPTDLSVSEVNTLLRTLTKSDTAAFRIIMAVLYNALPIYADDTAAGAGGVTAGNPYKTATGVVMTKL